MSDHSIGTRDESQAAGEELAKLEAEQSERSQFGATNKKGSETDEDNDM